MTRYSNCPRCDTYRTVTRRVVTEKFPYGDGPDQVTLEAVVPSFTCSACGFEFTDFEAEATRAAAIEKHLATKIV